MFIYELFIECILTAPRANPFCSINYYCIIKIKQSVIKYQVWLAQFDI